MECNHDGCQQAAEMSCKDCKQFNFFCGEHGLEHMRNSMHNLSSFDIKSLPDIIDRSLKSKIKECISTISKDTEEIITRIKSTSIEAIKKLKELNRGLKDLSKFQSILFDKNSIQNLKIQLSSLVNNSDNISKDNQEDNIVSSKISQFDSRTLPSHLVRKRDPVIVASESKGPNASLRSSAVISDKRSSSIDKNDSETKTGFSRHSCFAGLVKKTGNQEEKKSLNTSQINETLLKGIDPKIQGKDYQAFSKMSLQEKLNYVKKNWNFITIIGEDKELLISNNGIYLFRCNIHADCDLNLVGDYNKESI